MFFNCLRITLSLEIIFLANSKSKDYKSLNVFFEKSIVDSFFFANGWLKEQTFCKEKSLKSP